MIPTAGERRQPARVLVAAGSDPSGGAGLQADLKTIQSLGGHALTCVTAITVQDTARVHRVEVLPAELVAHQMRICLEEIGADAVKLGMLGNAAVVRGVAELLAEHPELPVVADPVLAGTGGGTLLDREGLEAFRSLLLPRVTLLTPNLREAALLAGIEVRGAEAMAAAGLLIATNGPAVLVKGGHQRGRLVTDVLITGQGIHRIVHPRLPGRSRHGTGCVTASAIATALAQGTPLQEAVEQGVAFVGNAWLGAIQFGSGVPLLRI